MTVMRMQKLLCLWQN